MRKPRPPRPHRKLIVSGLVGVVLGGCASTGSVGDEYGPLRQRPGVEWPAGLKEKQEQDRNKERNRQFRDNPYFTYRALV